jgi:hypothetical protein
VKRTYPLRRGPSVALAPLAPLALLALLLAACGSSAAATPTATPAPPTPTATPDPAAVCRSVATFAQAQPATADMLGAAFGHPPGSPGVPFPPHALGAISADLDDGAFHTRTLDLCVPFASPDDVRSYYTSGMAGLGWRQSSTYPYGGDPTRSCGDQYCWSWAAQNGGQTTRYASLENVRQSGQATLYRVRLANRTG